MSNDLSQQLERYAGVFKALSNPHRLRIFRRLASCCRPGTIWLEPIRNSTTVGDLGRELDIAPSTVSHHIKELRTAGLIRTRRQGKHIACWVDPGIVEELREFFAMGEG
jgi:ArsR family transcriptional regulator